LHAAADGESGHDHFAEPEIQSLFVEVAEHLGHHDHHEAPPEPSQDSALEGENCLLADHPPTTLCVPPTSLGKLELAATLLPVEQHTRSAFGRSAFHIRAPPAV
jgi:hypothetical protein